MSKTKLSQVDLRTIKIEKDGLALYLRYSYFWNNQERLPQSIVFNENYANAFFLSATIRDSFVEESSGLSILRSWSIMPAGNIKLNFTLDLSDPEQSSYFFPSLYRSSFAVKEGRMFLGERLSYPASLFLYHQAGSLLISGRQPENIEQKASIGTERLITEDESLLRIEIRLPAEEKPVTILGPRATHTTVETTAAIDSPGSFNMQYGINLTFAPLAEIHYRGALSILKSSKNYFHRQVKQNALAHSIEECLSTHLHKNRGIHGLRILEKSTTLSSYAGAGMAMLILKTLPKQGECALRLGDFVVKGQHPGGLFFENYDISRNRWLGLHSSRNLLSLEHASGTALFLMHLSRELKQRGLCWRKYFFAGRRMVDSFLENPKQLQNLGSVIDLSTLEGVEKGLGGLELCQPLLLLYKISGKERYKKALNTIKESFFSQYRRLDLLPSSRVGRDPDVKGALFLANAVLALVEAGLKIKNLDAYMSILLPWIYLNRSFAGGNFNSFGGVIDSSRRNRLLFCGYELSYLLLKLHKLLSGKRNDNLSELLASQVVGFTSQKPPGTAYFLHTLWDSQGKIKKDRGLFGPIDSRRLVREGYYLLKLKKEFPDQLS
ncbi:MAG: hypothetical protein GH155_03930 [Spirochaeta sp.]|nr:hypothetical protein [Spirochaeta sp.]